MKEFPRISFEPDPIDFGLIRLGENEIECRITNSGGLLLKVYRVELDSQSDAVFSVSELPQLVISDDNPMHVPVGESVTFKILIDAELENLYTGELILRSNDEDNGVMVIPITASAAEPEIEADPPELDFQNIDIGETVERTCTLSNIGAYPLEIETLEFGVVTSDFQIIGELPTLPLVLQKDESVDIVVSYSPDENSPDFGSLVIDSNDADEAHLIVPFINDGSPPKLEVVPAELNFSPQQEGTSVIKTLQVKNSGGRLLLLDDYVLETEGTVFYKANVPADMLGGGQMTLVKIGYQPDDLEDDSGSLTIFSNDPEDPELVVPITGGGQSMNIRPVAKAGEDGQSVPLATVQLDGSASYDTDGTVEAYFWAILDKPDASHAVPVRPTDAMPFVFFDLAGSYLFELNVTDDEGNVSLGDRVEYTVRPDERIHIQLLWDKDLVDFDLHLVKPEGQLWDGLAHGLDYPIQFGDCFFSTCKKEFDPVGGNPVDWSEQGHPSLDIDDQNGYGPENINLNDPTDTNQGDYVVYVHYWDAKYIPDPTTEVTVRIYINGEKEFEAVNTFTEEHQLWNVAAIRWMSNDDAVILDHGLDLEIDEHGQKKK